MKYKSTRDASRKPELVSSAVAIKEGLAPDGGLFIPESFPVFTSDDFTALLKMTYPERAAFILGKYLDDYNSDILLEACKAAYSEEKFPGGATQIHEMKDKVYSLELWHGPTCAFKDMALQIMPRLLSQALVMTEETRTAHILVATSGDTGKAALEGYKDVDGIKITVFFPVEGVSKMQKLQMQTTLGKNVYVAAVRGNFDDTQNGVKAIFSDRKLSKKADLAGFFFGSANSINWGRLAPQIVYYVSSYCDLVNQGKISFGDKINVCVPTGNFGNIFAAYIAKVMGLPVAKLIVASNSNNVLTDFIHKGVYIRTRDLKKTISPSMDILISSNLERLISVLGGPELTKNLMNELKKSGNYRAPETLMSQIRETFDAYCVDEDLTRATIKKVFDNEKYLIDPHTAVGYGAVSQYRRDTGDMTPIILASTASPYKFAPAVLDALKLEEGGDIFTSLKKLSEATGTTCPKTLTQISGMEVRFAEVIDPCDMPELTFRV